MSATDEPMELRRAAEILSWQLGGLEGERLERYTTAVEVLRKEADDRENEYRLAGYYDW